MNQKGYPSHCLTKVMALEAENFYVLDLSRPNFTYFYIYAVHTIRFYC
jgi:hypothetical protein